jgi:hypothetical protein
MVSRSTASVLSEGQTWSVRASMPRSTTPAAAAAALDAQRGVVGAQPVDDAVEVARRMRIHSRSSRRAVDRASPTSLSGRFMSHLRKSIAVLADEPVEPRVRPVGDVAAGEVEHQLVRSSACARDAGSAAPSPGARGRGRCRG